MNGKSPTSGPPTRWKAPGFWSNAYLSRVRRKRRHQQDHRDRPRVAPELAQNPDRHRERDAGAHPAPALPRSGPGTPRRDRCSPVRARRLAGVSVASRSPSRIRSSSSQCSASSITWLETSSVRPAAASEAKVAQSSRRSTGSRPTVGSSSTSRPGSPSSAVASETRERSPPERFRDLVVHVLVERDRRDRLIRLGRGYAQDSSEEAQVLADAEVTVDRRRLGHIGRPGGAAGAIRPRRPSTVDSACLDHLDADDRPHQRRLAAAARPEQARDPARRNREREVVQDGPAAAADAEAVDVDRRGRLHHRRGYAITDVP